MPEFPLPTEAASKEGWSLIFRFDIPGNAC